MELEHSTEETVTREQAAERLRQLADELARHNEVSFLRNGRKVTVDVPDRIRFKLEIEIGEESEIEMELTW